MSAETGQLYPLKPMSREEAVKVVAFRLHLRPRVFNDVAGIRFGFVILGVMCLVLVAIAGAVVLVAFGLAKP